MSFAAHRLENLCYQSAAGDLVKMKLLPRKTNLRILARHPALFVRAYWPALLILLAGASADGVTTFVALREYGPQTEVHPVQRWVSEILGVTAGVPLAKLAQVAFVVLVAAWWRTWCGWIMILCGLLYALAAVSNHFMWL